MKYLDKNQKHILAIFIAILLAGMLASCSRISNAAIKPPISSIRVVMDNNYPPYIFLDEQGNARGILVDQWTLWGKRTGVNVELFAVPWEDALAGMRDGKYDVIDTIFYTEERAETYDFTAAYALINVPIFFHNNISGIAGVDDLKGFRVAVKTGDADAEFLEKTGITGLVYYNSYEEIIRAAERKEETIFVLDQAPGLYFLYKYGLQSQFNHSAPLFSGKFHRAVKKGDTALLSLVEGGFAAISATEYREIDNRWFGISQNDKWQKYLPYLRVGVIIAFFAVCILIVFTRTLQKRVNQRTRELNQALIGLQKSERKYREIFNATTEAIFIYSAPGGHLLHVNESMLQMYGYDSEDEVLAQDASDLSAGELPYSDSDARQKMCKALEEGPQVFEWWARKKTGELFWTEVSLRSLQIGGEDQLLAVVRNTTERRQAEEALRASEHLLREAQSIADIGNYMLDFSTGMWQGSAVLDRIFGIDDSYIHSVEGWINLIHPDQQQQMNDYFTNEVIGKRAHFDMEYRIIRQNDQAERWVHGRGRLEVDAQNKLIKMHGVIQDITAHKQAEDEMRQRVMELKTLYESGLAINQLLDPKEIGKKVIELLEEKLGWHHTTVRLYHPQDERLELLAFNQPGFKSEMERREVEERFKTLITRTTQGLSGWAVRNKQVLRSNDLPHDPRYVDTYPGLQSGLYVPMKLGERVIGVISIESEQINVFSSADERLAATLANQAASALENARLFEAERKQRQVSDALRDALSAGASMSASLDFETILDRLLESLERVVPFEGGSIMFVQPEKQTVKIARVRGYKGLDEELVEAIIKYSFDIATVENLRWMLENKQPLVIPDIDQYPNWIRTQGTDFIRSWAGAPIIVNNEVVAFFSLDSTEPNFFTNDHIELLCAFTGQASLALQNARLFEETARRFKEFAALYETSNALSADNDLNTLLKNIVEHATKLLGTSTGAMYLCNRTNDNLEIVVTTTPLVSIGTILRLGEGVAGHVAQTRQPMRIENYSTWEGRSHKYDDVLFHAVLEVPMLFGGNLIGVLNVAEMGDSNRTFTEADERLLSLFAAQAAGVLHSARLREETANRAREFAALYETSNALSSENDLDTMLQVIVEHARKLLGALSGGMYLYLSETKELELTVDSTHSTPLGTRLQLDEGAAGRVAKTYKPLRLDDYSTWEGRSTVFEGSFIRAALEVPMLYGGELIGVLTAEEMGDSERKFTEADERLLSLFASQAAGAIHSARLRQQTARHLNQLQALHIIDRAISSSFDLRPVLNTVIAQTIAQLDVDAVDVLLYHPHLKILDYVTGQGFRTRAIEQTRLRLGECFAGHSAFERRTIHVPNLPESGSSFTRAAILEGEGFLEYYAVPLIAKGEVKGVLEVFNRTPLPLNPEWVDFLETLAGQAAITIDQTQLFDDLQRANLELVIAYDATIEGWARAMDLRDEETENHTRRVTEMTLSLARALGITGNDILHIRRGALLHDIGKMGVPDNILLKEGELTAEEWVLMRRHPQFAYEMLQPIKYLRQSLDIPYCHHEKWDGTGYPRGLKGEQIPIAARIFAIIDVWDAVTSDRPYRKGWTEQKALAHIQEQSGKQFDPKIVDAFLKIAGSEKTGVS